MSPIKMLLLLAQGSSRWRPAGVNEGQLVVGDGPAVAPSYCGGWLLGGAERELLQRVEDEDL
jgi:hypothetical protein